MKEPKERAMQLDGSIQWNHTATLAKNDQSNEDKTWTIIRIKIKVKVDLK